MISLEKASLDLTVGYDFAMRTILSIDTSSRYCSLALSDNGKISSVSELLDRSHTNLVLPMIDVLYRKADLRLADTDLVCFAAGQAVLLVSGSRRR